MFEGFTGEATDFLLDVRFNNEREWFNPRKEIYREQVYKPMCQLSEELFAYFREKRPDYNLMNKTSRIYRDARRLHGRGPYRDHLWLGIEPPSEEWTDKPSFWFSLSGDGWSSGVCYPARPTTLERLREKIAKKPQKMEKLMRQIEKQSDYVFDFDFYKKPKGAAPSKKLEPWFSARRFSLERVEDLSPVIYTPKLLDELERGIDIMLPFFDYLYPLAAEGYNI